MISIKFYLKFICQVLKSLYNFVGDFRCSKQTDFFLNIEKRSIISSTTYFVNSKLSSASRLFCMESRKIQFSISTRKPTTWNVKIALQGGSEEDKEKLEVSFSHARTTRKEQKQRAPLSLPTRFTRIRRTIAPVGTRFAIWGSEHTASYYWSTFYNNSRQMKKKIYLVIGL